MVPMINVDGQTTIQTDGQMDANYCMPEATATFNREEKYSPWIHRQDISKIQTCRPLDKRWRQHPKQILQ